MSKRSPELLIQDIIESAQKILDYTKGLTYDEFKSDSMCVDAVIRNFEIIYDNSKAEAELIAEKEIEDNTFTIHNYQKFNTIKTISNDQ